MDTYTYIIGKKLYINLTNECSNRCSFCVRNQNDRYEGYALWLEKRPTAKEVIDSIENPSQFEEIVFCGYGEPTYQLKKMLEICDWIHSRNITIRLNTNGQGSAINKRNIVSELLGKIDKINISLNAPDEETYNHICNPRIEGAYYSLLEFAKSCKEVGIECWFSIVDCIGEENIKKCLSLAKSIGIPLKIRKFIDNK